MREVLAAAGLAVIVASSAGGDKTDYAQAGGDDVTAMLRAFLDAPQAQAPAASPAR